MINFYCIDNIEFMKTKPDKYYDLAIVDPEYGIDAANMTMGKGKNKKWSKKNWDKTPPDERYFSELFRVSKHQLIFGGNYFDLPKTGGWIFWDKDRNKDVSFADGELIWTDFLSTIKKLTIKYDGFLGADAERIHPTQKPIRLYRHIFDLYTKPGMKVLDTHGGSMSIAIAADEFEVDLDITEIDKEYFKSATARYYNYKRQPKLFANPKAGSAEQKTLKIFTDND